jgi:hypothetical protein
MTFSPELYIVAFKKWMVYVLYIFNLYIYQKQVTSFSFRFTFHYFPFNPRLKIIFP